MSNVHLSDFVKAYDVRGTVPDQLSDEVARAFGAHGEHVAQAADLPAALARAHAAGRVACVNVSIERLAAPAFRRG